LDPATETAIKIGFPLLLLIVTYLIGSAVEKSHYRNIRVREIRSRRFPAVNFRTPPKSWNIVDARMVAGNVVVSIDYFKRLLAGLRMIFGGRVSSYETLLDRARREAILRMKEKAFEDGYNAVINVRIETSRMASSNRKGEGTAGVEILAFGTAVKFAR
jgi:uncharacterized protein YbjQ (UPF0145 family)